MNKITLFRGTTHLVLLAACGTGLFMLARQAAATPLPHGPAPAAAASAPAGAVVAGDFEGKAETSKDHGTFVRNHGQEIGWGWSATDDSRMGGHSAASIRLIHPGAGGTQGALHVEGELKSGFISPWAGAVWFPGSRPMQPADLSGWKVLSFRVRGKPGSYSVMLMAGSARSIPAYASFDVTREWTRVRLPLQRSFPAADLKQVYFVAFSADGLGPFQFDLDRVTLTGP